MSAVEHTKADLSLSIRQAEVFDLSNLTGTFTAASAIVSPWDDRLFIYRVFVRPDCRRAGYGTRLMEAIIKLHWKTNLYLQPSPWADESVDQDVLFSWYSRLGFEMFDESRDLMIRRAAVSEK